MSEEMVEKRRGFRIGLIIFVLIVLFFIIGSILIFIGLNSLFKTSEVRIKPNSTLILRLDRPIQEYPVDPFTERFFGAKVYSFHDLHEALKRAKEDDRIKSLLIIPTQVPISLAKAEELKKDIEEFKKAKKPVYAFIESTGNSGYFIASSADKIYAPPSAMFFISGIYSELPFLREFLDKIKIEPQLYHIGDYKSYSDTFTRKNMSEAHREQMNCILDSLYKTFTLKICENGRFDESEINEIIDKGLQTGDYLKSSKLIDDFLYLEDVYELLKKENKTKDVLNKVEISSYIRDKRISLSTSKKAIGVVIASGEIVSGNQKGNIIASDRLCKLLEDARKDSSIKAIVLRVDSPGGSGLASDVIAKKIIEVKKEKPVIVSMSSVAASGGYYISCLADAIVAENSTITGSIGVVTGKFVFKGLTDWAGINFEIMKRGKNADLFSPIQRFSEEQEKIVIEHMEEFYKVFLSRVAEGRKMTIDEVHKIAQGRIYSGEDALKIGLVDKIGGIDEAIELAKMKANIKKDEQVTLKYFPKPKSFFETFMNISDEDVKSEILKIFLPEEYATFEENMIIINLLNREPILYFMPYKIKTN